jgi:S2P endopeptidase
MIVYSTQCSAVTVFLTVVNARYLVSLSGALAILNVVPCYALDGQWILLAFVELASRRCDVSRRTCSAVYSCLLLFGTLTLFANIVIGVWLLLVK